MDKCVFCEKEATHKEKPPRILCDDCHERDVERAKFYRERRKRIRVDMGMLRVYVPYHKTKPDSYGEVNLRRCHKLHIVDVDFYSGGRDEDNWSLEQLLDTSFYEALIPKCPLHPKQKLIWLSFRQDRWPEQMPKREFRRVPLYMPKEKQEA